MASLHRGIRAGVAAALAIAPAAMLAAPLTHVASIEAGGVGSCAVTTAGTSLCWGAPDGSGGSPYPTPVSSLGSGVAAVSIGYLHSCALTTAGGVKCWGINAAGQLGNGAQSRTNQSFGPVDVVGLQNGVAAVAAGGTHTCALTTAGGVKCWGSDGLGVGAGGTTSAKPSPVDVQGLPSGVGAIAVSDAWPLGGHSCALTLAGGVKCWGPNTYGQLGDGTRTDRAMPVDVSGLSSGVVAISAGWRHSCAVMSGGGVKCWGTGMLGPDSPLEWLTPMDIPSVTGAVSVSSGDDFTCIFTSAGAVQCWGRNASGQLGDGTFANRATAATVSGLSSGVLGISAGAAHACAWLASGQAACWGANGTGQIGDNTMGTARPTPVTVNIFAAQTIDFPQPASVDVGAGAFTVTVSASSGLPVTLTSLAPSICTVSGATVTPIAIGVCHLVASQAGNQDYLAAAQVPRYLQVAGPNAAAPRLNNISTRGLVGTGDDVLIAGFIVADPGPKTVVLRARGPSLASGGLAGPLADPALRLVRSSDAQTIAANDNWLQIGYLEGIGLAPADSRESAIVIELPSGAYTAVLQSSPAAPPQPSGVGIVEVFEIDRPESPLSNISTRGRVDTGDGVMIAGFVVHGTGPQSVLVRARGPSLAAAGVADALANPTLRLVRSSDFATLGTNDDWQTASNAAAISASGLAPASALESAILVTLEPGAYTAIVSGVGGGTGLAIVEVFAR